MTRDLIAALAIAALVFIGTWCAMWYIHDKERIMRETIVNSIGHEIYRLQELTAPLQEIGRPMNYTLLGWFDITAYTNGERSIDVPKWRDGMTSTGTLARPGTCAVGRKRPIPFGTLLYIQGMGVYCRVEDTGGLVKGIDVFVHDEGEALQIGRTKQRVYRVREVR